MVENESQKVSGSRCFLSLTAIYFVYILLPTKHSRFFFEVAKGSNPD